MYTTGAKLLGATGYKKRVKLPRCVTKRIGELHPDADKPATKVGFKRAPCVECALRSDHAWRTGRSLRCRRCAV